MNPGELSHYNKSLGLPKQAYNEVTFNSSIHLAPELHSFNLPEFYCCYNPKTPEDFFACNRYFREALLVEYTSNLPSSLNVILAIPVFKQNYLWVRSYEPNKQGLGVIVERHIFFHKHLPVSTLDTIFEKNIPFVSGDYYINCTPHPSYSVELNNGDPDLPCPFRLRGKFNPNYENRKR